MSDIETYNDLEDMSPEEIAQVLFANQPKEPLSHQMLSLQEGVTDIGYIFEILSTILLEALNILTQGLNNYPLENFTQSHLSELNPWFHSLGFHLNSSMHMLSDNNEFNDYYCRVMIRNKLTEHMFKAKNLTSNYHFLLSHTKYQQVTNNPNNFSLKDLHLVYLNVDDIVYKISFDYYIPPTSCSSNA